MKSNEIQRLQQKAKQAIEALQTEDQTTEPDKSKRSVCIRFYVTPEEEHQIDQLCDGQCTRSRWIRARVLGHPLPLTKIPAINRDLYVQSRENRTQINRIIAAINRASQQQEPQPLTEHYLQILKQIYTQQLQVEKELSKLNSLAAGTGATEAPGESG